MSGLLGLVVLFLDIVAIVHIWKSKAEQTHQILWTLLVLIFPLVGFIIWLIAGPKATPKIFDIFKKA